MLTISTIAEALAELEKQTGRAWTDSELFDVATNRGVELHAAPPIIALTTIQKFVVGEGLVEKFRSEPGHAALAVLFPSQVGQLWISGETFTSHPNKNDQTDDEYQWFTEPVRVTREQVRIKAESLKKVVDAWHKAQAGRWIKDEKQPGGMRWQRPPDWMFPADPVPATDTAPAQTAPAPVVANGKKWTPEKKAELKAYRERHTEKETAEKFSISGARIRQLLPTGKTQKKPYSVFTHRPK